MNPGYYLCELVIEGEKPFCFESTKYTINADLIRLRNMALQNAGSRRWEIFYTRKAPILHYPSAFINVEIRRFVDFVEKKKKVDPIECYPYPVHVVPTNYNLVAIK